MAPCDILHGPKRKAVRSGATRRRAVGAKLTQGSGLTLMAPAAGSLTTDPTREATKNGLRHDYPALAAGRRVRRCLRQRIADRDRGARTQVDQSVRCRA